MSWKRNKQRSNSQEDILLINLNELPNYNSLKTIMLKYNDEKTGLKKAKQLFIKRCLQFIEAYIYILDKNNEIHIQLLSKYLFNFINQIDSKLFVNQLDNLLNKYKLNLNLLICKELFNG